MSFFHLSVKHVISNHHSFIYSTTHICSRPLPIVVRGICSLFPAVCGTLLFILFSYILHLSFSFTYDSICNVILDFICCKCSCMWYQLSRIHILPSYIQSSVYIYLPTCMYFCACVCAHAYYITIVWLGSDLVINDVKEYAIDIRK